MNRLIDVYDLSPNAAVQAHVMQVSQRVGFDRVMVGSGAVFGPSLCEAVATVVTDDPCKYQRVAETIRPGWRRPDVLVRSPRVAMWGAEPASSGEQSGSG